MVVYEVNLRVEREIAGPYLAWLKDHVAEMLGLPGFLSARIFEAEGPAEDPAWSIQYHMESRQALEDYFSRYALVMREKGLKAFGNRFSASRRILNLVHSSDSMTAPVG